MRRDECERAEGVRLIEEQLFAYAKQQGTKLEAITWNPNHGSIVDGSRSSHMISVIVDDMDRNVDAVPDEWVINYPGGIEVKKLNAWLYVLVGKV